MSKITKDWCLNMAAKEGDAEIGAGMLARDPRDPDHSRTGIFVYHNCAYCRSGELPCKQGHPSRCEYLRARND